MDSTYSRIIWEIKDKSKVGLIAWHPSSYADVYEAQLGKGAITIMHNLNAADGCTTEYEPPIATLSFLNERGEVFNSIHCYKESDTAYKDLKSIYEYAHNSYMKIDETIQSMFTDLQSRK